MPKMIKPPVYESPLDDFEGRGHMKVAEIAEQLNLKPEEIFEKLRYRTHALSDFSQDGSKNDSIHLHNSEAPMPPEFVRGYIPEYAWNQLINGV